MPNILDYIGLPGIGSLGDLTDYFSGAMDRPVEHLQTEQEKERENLRNQIMNELYETYMGGEQSPEMQQLISQLSQKQRGFTPAGAYALPGGAPTPDLQFQGATPISQQQISDYFQATVGDPLTRRYEQEIMPGIEAGGSLHTGFKARQRQEAAENLASTLAQGESSMLMENLRRNQELANLTGQQQLTADIAGQNLLADLYKSQAGMGLEAYESAAQRAQQQAQFGTQAGLQQGSLLASLLMQTDPRYATQQAMTEFAFGTPTPSEWIQQPSEFEQWGAFLGGGGQGIGGLAALKTAFAG